MEPLTAPEDLQRTILNILEDFDEEGATLRAAQSAILNILNDSLTERATLESTQRGVLNILEDFDEERQRLEEAQRAMLNSEERFRSFVEFAPDAVVTTDPEGRITLVNAQVEALFRYERADLLGQPVEVLLPERFRRAHVHHRAGYLEERKVRPMGTGLDLYGRRKNGSEFPVEISLSPLKTERGVLLAAAIRDVTERKRLEAMRDESATPPTSSGPARRVGGAQRGARPPPARDAHGGRRGRPGGPQATGRTRQRPGGQPAGPLPARSREGGHPPRAGRSHGRRAAWVRARAAARRDLPRGPGGRGRHRPRRPDPPGAGRHQPAHQRLPVRGPPRPHRGVARGARCGPDSL